jgi:hypothetical protein
MIQIRILLKISIKLNLSLLAPFLCQIFVCICVRFFSLGAFLIIRPARALFKFTLNFHLKLILGSGLAIIHFLPDPVSFIEPKRSRSGGEEEAELPPPFSLGSLTVPLLRGPYLSKLKRAGLECGFPGQILSNPLLRLSLKRFRNFEGKIA